MDKTLIILGAGASKDFCRVFPTGLELIKDINYHFLTEKKYPAVSKSEGIYLSALMNDIFRVFENDVELFKLIKNQLWKIQLDYEWRNLRNEVNAPVSIDNFIATKIKEGELIPRAADIIKYSIYYLIKGSEQAFSEGRHNHLNGNWIKELAKKLSNYGFNDIAENLTVVTFNYDRTFEKYFPVYLNERISLTTEQITYLQTNVEHVYGYLGDLNEIPFELKNNRVDIFKDKYKRIQFIGDRNKTELPRINADKYKQVHFIGFGYDKTNMELINIKRFTSASFHGTAYYCTDSQIKELETEHSIYATDKLCSEYVKGLTL